MRAGSILMSKAKTGKAHVQKKEKLLCTVQGQAGFDFYYENLYKERWQSLRSSLLQTPRYIALSAASSTSDQPYFLDCGSVLAACMLPLENAESVLDMCAAPGGKSLVLLRRIAEYVRQNPKDAKLPLFVCNEPSASRRNRLVSVLDTYADSALRSSIKVTSYDGARWCRYETEKFERILLDAPCSSERHVLQDDTYLKKWSPARIKNLTHKQWALLSSAFRLLKPKGFILYATCALSEQENDGTVKKLLKKNTEARLVPLNPDECCFEGLKLCGCEKTECGFHVLPDTQSGAGPLYFSLVQKGESE